MVRTSSSSIAAAGLLVWLGLLACVANGFVVGNGPARGRTTVVTMEASQSPSSAVRARTMEIGSSRREVVFSGAAIVLSSAVLLGSLRPALAAGSAAGSFYPQVLAGYKELVALDGPEWEATKAKGGDEVRRRLGYVGTKSPLFKIQKAFRAIQDDLLEGDGSGADPLEFADASQRVLDKVKDADFLAYSNNFSSYGNGGGGTDYLEESHKALKPALEAYKEIIDMLGLK